MTERAIKFRAWHKPTKRLFEVHSFGPDFVFENTTDGVHTGPTNPANRADCHLLQFTGLFDMAGNDVYEGDIIATTGEDAMEKSGFYTVYNAIVFEEGSFGIIGENTNQMDPVCMCGGAEGATVVGNVFENAHLLKSDEDEHEEPDDDIPDELKDIWIGQHCHLTGMGKVRFEVTEIKYDDLFPVGVAPVGETKTAMFVRAASIKPIHIPDKDPHIK